MSNGNTRKGEGKADRGFFAIGVVHGKSAVNIGTLWRTANIFGAAFIFTVGRRYGHQCSDTMKTPRHVPLFHFATVDDLVQHLPQDCPLLGVELHPDAEPSHRLKHPARACYLLGAEDHGLSMHELQLCHRTLVLPGDHSLNVAVAGSLVVYDRWRQRAGGCVELETELSYPEA